MASKGQLTGMRGVYLAAAELAREGLVASPTSRSAKTADILVTDEKCSRAWTVQVKTNASTFSFFLLGEKDRDIVSPSHVYVLVNLRESPEFYIVPSRVVSEKMSVQHAKKSATGSIWYSIATKDVKEYQNRWDLFKPV